MSETKTVETVKTVWSIRTYDVWGNEEDGWTVNDSFTGNEIELELAVTLNDNPGYPGEWKSAYPSDAQLQEVFGETEPIEVDGCSDDLTIYVNRASDGYPLGELHCESHESLSPLREKLDPMEDFNYRGSPDHY